MDGWMYGSMVELTAMAMPIVMARCQHCISPTQAINSTARARSTLASTAITAAYATAAAVGKGE